MRFETLRSVSFGPFQNEELTFKEGLNVIYGPNEAGKSSWHAALFAGLCGLRRRSGKRTAEREFEEQHRPWDGDDWQVDLCLSLADGRRVELSQNLDTHRGTVKDVDLGRDYADEIMFEGAPDGSNWLGLNREIFPAVACIAQGQLLGILEKQESLQEHLQRAADTFGVKGTAAEALSLIREFRRTQVGTIWANSRRPLRLAMDEVDRAEGELTQAREGRHEYEKLLEEKALSDRKLEEVRSTRRLSEAGLARVKAGKARARNTEVVRLAENYTGSTEQTDPDGAEPSMIRELENRSADVRRRFIELQGRQSLYSRIGVVGVVLLVAGILAFVLTEAFWVSLAGLVLGAEALLLAWFRNRQAVNEETRLRKEQTTLQRLMTLLDGQSLQELSELVEALERRATEKAEGVDPVELDNLDLPWAESQLDVVRRKEGDCATDVTRLETQLSERRRSILPVAECEEALEGARAELARARRLDETLDLTTVFLQKAEEQVHRSIAPPISEVIRRWLPAISGHRYRDARVDPDSLVVEVQAESGQWRKATHLSHGTAEQIYLLLRVALVQYLTEPDEICPLILDDVTVQSDSTRTRAILDTLLAISRERQVILFSQEDEVLEWAEENLRDGAHSLVSLNPGRDPETRG